MPSKPPPWRVGWACRPRIGRGLMGWTSGSNRPGQDRAMDGGRVVLGGRTASTHQPRLVASGQACAGVGGRASRTQRLVGEWWRSGDAAHSLTSSCFNRQEDEEARMTSYPRAGSPRHPRKRQESPSFHPRFGNKPPQPPRTGFRGQRRKVCRDWVSWVGAFSAMWWEESMPWPLICGHHGRQTSSGSP